MTLPPNDAKLFFELMWKLQYYVNQKYGFHKNISSMEEYANLPTKQKMKARDELWKTPELIEAYVQENPDALPAEVAAAHFVSRIHHGTRRWLECGVDLRRYDLVCV